MSKSKFTGRKLAKQVQKRNSTDFKNYELKHVPGASKKGERDVFFIWLVLMFTSVLAAHFILNVSGGGITGFVTAEENPIENISMAIDAMFVLFIVVLIFGISYAGVTQKDE